MTASAPSLTAAAPIGSLLELRVNNPRQRKLDGSHDGILGLRLGPIILLQTPCPPRRGLALLELQVPARGFRIAGQLREFVPGHFAVSAFLCERRR